MASNVEAVQAVSKVFRGINAITFGELASE
jgi:hypothetical protein